MHLDRVEVSLQYRKYTERKRLFIMVLLSLGILAFLASLSIGISGMSFEKVIKGLLGLTTGREKLILWNIRLPQALSAVVAGAGLSLAGVAMQAILRNPLGSPFTLGYSHAGAFGAAFTVMLMGFVKIPAWASAFGPGLIAIGAFIACMVATVVILLVSSYRGASPESIILCGVALGSLFTAGTMFLQFFADDVQLAAMVFWTFGDLGRATWQDLGVMSTVVFGGGLYFFSRRWDFNAIEAGDETAKGLGVNVSRLRLVILVVASLMVSVTVAYLGVIGFVGLICPHAVRRIIGDDSRYLIPGSCITGALLLLLANIAAKQVLSPHVVPVSVLTSFLGAPAFLWLLIKGKR